MNLRLCNNSAVENRAAFAYNEKGLAVEFRGFSPRLGKAHMKRICSLLLAAVLSLSVFGCRSFDPVAASFVGLLPSASAAHTSTEHAHTDLSFAELSDDASELPLEIARTKELLFRIDAGELCGTAAQRNLEARIDAFHRLRTAASIAYVHYCENIADDAQRESYERLSASLNELGSLLIEAELALSRDPALSELYDEQTTAKIEKEASLHDPCVQPLIERERALIGAYDALASLTVTHAGRTWTRDAILSDPSLDYETFLTLYRLYRHTYNERAGEIYLELVKTRNETARALGFDSYVEYGYAAYERDYTPDDALRLAQTVKRELVPVFCELQEGFYDATMRLGCGTFRREETLSSVRSAILALLPEFETPWDYMVSHGMSSFDASGTRMEGSFTTYFETYGAPFLFTSWDDSYDMPTTLLHEFGHYAGYYLNGIQRMQSSDPLDLAEIDSQGLELLAVTQYNKIYGAWSDAARLANLVLALYAVVTGCMEDEFQQFAYRTDSVTTQMLNAEYETLAKAYGLYDMGLTGESWTEISHTFRSPMYYVSYATSMLGALQLLERAEKDLDGAVQAYRTILMRPVGATFQATLRDAGLSDPFDGNTVSALAKRIAALCEAGSFRERNSL